MKRIIVHDWVTLRLEEINLKRTVEPTGTCCFSGRGVPGAFCQRGRAVAAESQRPLQVSASECSQLWVFTRSSNSSLCSSGGSAARPRSVVKFTASSTGSCGARRAAGRRPVSASRTDPPSTPASTEEEERGALLAHVYLSYLYVCLWACWRRPAASKEEFGLWCTRLRGSNQLAL